MQACGQSERTWGRGWRQWWGGCRSRGLKSLIDLLKCSRVVDETSWLFSFMIHRWTAAWYVGFTGQCSRSVNKFNFFLRGSPELPLAGGHREGVASLLEPWFQHPQGYPCSKCFINWRKAAQSDCFAPRSSTFWNLTTACSSFATSATLPSQGMSSWWSEHSWPSLHSWSSQQYWPNRHYW